MIHIGSRGASCLVGAAVGTAWEIGMLGMKSFIVASAIVLPLILRRLRRSLCAGSSGWVAWVSVDPRSGDIVVYDSGIARVVEAAHARGAEQVDLAPYFTGATVVFKTDGKHVQQTGPARSRDVRRLTLQGPGGIVRLHVYKPRYTWKAAGQSEGAEERLAQVSPDSVVSVGAAHLGHRTFGKLNKFAENVRNLLELMNEKRQGLQPQWEWCQKVNILASQAHELSTADWGMYTKDQNSAIENAYRAGRPDVAVEVGVRRFNIVFTDRGFAKQEDEEHRTRRLVRRRLVPAQELPTENNSDTNSDGEHSCAMCLQSFHETVAMPACTLPCGHTFHLVCTQPLAIRGSTCPMCRSEVDWDAIRGEQ